MTHARGPKSEWDLPVPVRAIVPPALLPAPAASRDDDDSEPRFAPRFLSDDEEDF